MSNSQSSSTKKALQGWLYDTRGASAIEFSLVAIPFFLLVFAILGSSLYFFVSTSLEHGVRDAARNIRTGEAKQSSTTIADFRQSVCDEAGAGINCKKLRVLIQSDPSWAGITPEACVDANNELVNSTGAIKELVSDYAGDASSVALITVCYEWDLADTFSFLKLGKGPNGSGAAVIQAATAFRVEPHPYD